MMWGNKFVIFTDLDGTLLDVDTYSFEPALPALLAIKRRKIPLIFCTSKTRGEIEHYRKLLGNTDPFISENGGGIFIPRDWLGFSFKHKRGVEGYKVIELGTPYKELVEVLNSIRNETGIRVKGFFDMTISEVAEICGLSEGLAALAKVRDYDEPFLIEDGKDDKESIELVKKEITSRGFRFTEGGRLYHLTGENDKGKAVEILTGLIRKELPDITTLGIGDSLNDLPMLEVVDIPIVVKKPDGKFDPKVNTDKLIFADGVGPEGWNNIILKLLREAF